VTGDEPPVDATPVALVRWAFERIGRGDVSGIRQIATYETVGLFPEGTYRGADEIAARMAEEISAFDGWHLEVVAAAGEGEDVLIRWRMSGTHAAPFDDIPATGKPVAANGIDHLVVRDGKVVSVFTLPDRTQLAAQLGMMPPPGSAGDRAFRLLFAARIKLARMLRRRR
jgi:predicted ester cyclase